MTYQNLLLAESVAQERDRDRRLDIAQRRGDERGTSVSQADSVLAQRWHDALVHLRLAQHHAR